MFPYDENENLSQPLPTEMAELLAVAPAPIDAYEPAALKGRVDEIVRLSFLGMANAEIARELGMSICTVAQTLSSELGKDLLAHLEERADENAVNVRRVIDHTAPLAANLLRRVIEGDEALPNVSTALRVSTAKDMLDRAGHGKVTKVLSVNANISLGIEEIKARAKEIGLERGVVLEVPA